MKNIAILIAGGTYIPLAYIDEQDNVHAINTLLTSTLPANLGLASMIMPSADYVPNEIKGAQVPILCRVNEGNLIPMYSECFTRYGVSYYSQEPVNVQSMINLIQQVSKQVVKYNLPTIPYETLYNAFYTNYTNLLAQQQAQNTPQPQQEQTDSTQLQSSEPVQSVQQESIQSEPTQQEPTQFEPIQQEQPTSSTQLAEKASQSVKGFSQIREDILQEQKESTEEDDTIEFEVTQPTSNTTNFSNSNLEANFLNLGVKPDSTVSLVYQANDNITEAAEAIKKISLPKHFSELPNFIPTVYKLDAPAVTPIEPPTGCTKICDMNLEVFGTMLTNLYYTPAVDLTHSPALSYFKQELEYVFGSKVDLLQLLNVVSIEQDSNIAFLYELSKFIVVQKSPNGLYNNKYFFLFLIETEFAIQGKNPINRLASVFTGLCCDMRKYEAMEEEVNEDDDSARDSITVNKLQEAVRSANSTVRHLLIGICDGTEPIECSIAGANEISLSPIEKICILSTYKCTFTVANNLCLKAYNFDSIQISFPEYNAILRYFGSQVDITALGRCIRELSSFVSLRRDPNSNIYKLSQEDYTEQLNIMKEQHSYDKELTILQSTNPFISKATRQADKLISLGSLDLSVEKFIIGKYNGKLKPLGIIVTNHSPLASINARTLVLPIISCIYKELALNGITIKGLYNNADDLQLVQLLEDDGLLRELTKIPFDTSDKTKLVCINLSEPVTSIGDLRTKISTAKISGVDTRMIRVPAWLNDSQGINLGFKYLFN